MASRHETLAFSRAGKRHAVGAHEDHKTISQISFFDVDSKIQILRTKIHIFGVFSSRVPRVSPKFSTPGVLGPYRRQ
jgi:hypothetical protein